MDKVAMVKQAEVNGVIAGLVDGGYVKLASEDDFNMVCEAVAGNVSDEWDFNEVIEKTAAVMEEVNAIYEQIEAGAGAPEDLEKEASTDEVDLLAAYGKLTLMKQAEEIDDETYQTEATKLQKAMAATKAGAGKAVDATKAGAGKALGLLKANKGKVVAGVGAGALTAAGLKHGKNMKYLYDTYKKDPEWGKQLTKIWLKDNAANRAYKDAASWVKNFKKK
jgi:hypothetical protein